MIFTEADQDLIVNKLRDGIRYFTLYDVKFGSRPSLQAEIEFRGFLLRILNNEGYKIINVERVYPQCYRVTQI